MEKQTKILIGAGALALVYYLYNARKASAAVSPIGKATMPPITTPASPEATTPMSPSLKDAIKELGLPVKVSPYPIGDIQIGDLQTNKPFQKTKDCVQEGYDCTKKTYNTIQIPLDADCRLYQPSMPQCLEKIDNDKIILQKREFDRKEAEKQAAEADRIAAQEEADRIAEILAYEEENARQEARNIANKKAYESSEHYLMQKAMNAFMYPTCPDGFEFYQNNCMPTYIIVEEKAKIGEGLVLRDFKNNTTTLVQTCPAEYVKQGINCISRYSLSPKELQVLAMEEAGMVQTSDGQWYTSAKAAADAQEIIDSYKNSPPPPSTNSTRQSNINDAICSVDVYGFINNPNSSSNGMSLREYIGQFKVTSSELGIASNSCPNSIFSSGRIYGGRPDFEILAYRNN